MIPCWYVQIEYETQDERVRVMNSLPVTYTEARAMIEKNERYGHRAHMVELEQVTEIHRQVLALALSGKEANKQLRKIWESLPQTGARRRQRGMLFSVEGASR